VTIAARYPEHEPAPVSGIATQEIYTLVGTAVASGSGTRQLVGVAAQGMTAARGIHGCTTPGGPIILQRALSAGGSGRRRRS
jgi:hypothetical protein